MKKLLPISTALLLLLLATLFYLSCSFEEQAEYGAYEGKEMYVDYADVILDDFGEWACLEGKLYKRHTWTAFGVNTPYTISGNHLTCEVREEAYWEDYSPVDL